jgi:hypothetical protein
MDTLNTYISDEEIMQMILDDAFSNNDTETIQRVMSGSCVLENTSYKKKRKMRRLSILHTIEESEDE